MEFAALVLSVEAARREARSALPQAETRKQATRRSIWAALRRLFGGSPRRAGSRTGFRRAAARGGEVAAHRDDDAPVSRGGACALDRVHPGGRSCQALDQVA